VNKNVKKVPSAATLPCKFRGKWIECPIKDIADNLCPVCGWNPDIEADRIKEMRRKK